ncbi:MAG: HAD hydrolase-like protein [Casimicrobiaceae bacterium]
MTQSAAPVLLFDLDGTLTDNYPGITRSILYALDRMGVAPPVDGTLLRCVGPPLRESFAWLLDTRDVPQIEQAIAFYRERYADVGWRENVVYDGIDEMLATLAGGPSRLFLCTSKPELFARRIVTLFGLSGYLDGIYGADLEGRLDDKVKLLAHLAATEGVDTERTIMIGDRSHDIRAARMNGTRSVGVLWGYGAPEELAGADAIVATPAELPAALAAVAGQLRQ